MQRRTTDILFVSLVCLVVLSTTSLPYYLQWRNAPRGEHFTGIIFAISDQNSYFMWMRQAAEGKILWRDLMTTDPHEPFFTNLLWLALGRISRVGLSLEVVYHLSRMVFIILFLIALYALLGALLREVWRRRVALLLIATGTGLTWLFIALNLPEGPQGPAGTAAFGVPELLAWPSMALLPHFTAVLAGMVGVFYLTLAAYRRPEQWPLYAGAGGLLLALLAGFHVYDVVTVTAVLIGHWLLARRVGQAPGHSLGVLASVLLPGLAVTTLVGLMLKQSPVGQAWAESNVMLSYSPFAYAVGLGLPLLVALADHRRIFHWREMEREEILVSAWLLINVLLIFTDGVIPFERRLVMGIQIPVVILAVRNWGDYVVPLLSGSRPPPALRRAGSFSRTLAWGLLALVTWPGTAQRMSFYSSYTAYLSDDFLRTAHHLEALPPGQGVLCTAYLGNWLPRLTGQAVYVGHGELTPHLEGRRALVRRFFSPQPGNRWRRQVLAQAHCNYVLARAQEREPLASAVSDGVLVPELILPTMTLYRAAESGNG